MNIKEIIQYTTCLLLVFTRTVLSKPPHIIFMLIDDLGWNDVSFHGSLEIPTPNIDTLAHSGAILNNYYVQPLCTPSRGSLMTGKYPIKLGLQHYVISASEPWGLGPEEVLLPEYLQGLGYATHGVGKWHLGYFKKEYLPNSRGFDSFLGYYTGKEDFFTHFEEDSGRFGLDFHDNEENAWNYTGYYATEAFTDRAKRIIENHNQSKPLFLYLAHQAVHSGNGYSPLQAPIEYIENFPHIKDYKRKVFAAMTSALDKSVGEVFSALHEENMLQDSIIIFSTDNGGAVDGIDKSSSSNWPLRGSKYNMWEGGIRGTAFIWSPLLPVSKGFVSENLMHISDWLPTLYAAAGGDPRELGAIDGYNLWPSLIDNVESPRDHILCNIDEEWKVEGIRKGRYKLLKGSALNGQFDGWFDKEGKKQENTQFEDEELHTQRELYETLLEESEVFLILTKKDRHYSLFNAKQSDGVCESEESEIEETEETSDDNNAQGLYPHAFAPPVEVDCGIKPENASTNCQPMKEYCLFDVKNDPCEYNNLADSMPSVVQELKELLDKYRSESVPIRNKPVDPEADPKYHGYAWVTWQ